MTCVIYMHNIKMTTYIHYDCLYIDNDREHHTLGNDMEILCSYEVSRVSLYVYTHSVIHNIGQFAIHYM